jgi:hypothetical protein
MAKTKGVSIRDLGENLKGINFEIFGGIDGFLAMTSGTGDSDIARRSSSGAWCRGWQRRWT